MSTKHEVLSSEGSEKYVETDTIPVTALCAKEVPKEFKSSDTFNDLIRQNIEQLGQQYKEFTINETGTLLRRYIESEGFSDHHIEVYNNWIDQTACTNIRSRILTFPSGKTVTFENLVIFPPRYTRTGKVVPMTPKLAREQGVTYAGDWHVDVVLRDGGYDGPVIDRKTGVCIGSVPTMLKSNKCILHGKTRNDLISLGEDPRDPGGYFIVDGVEKVVLSQEQLVVNRIFLMKMDSKSPPVERFTSNTTNGTTLIELTLDKKTRSFIKIKLPSMRPSLTKEEIVFRKKRRKTPEEKEEIKKKREEQKKEKARNKVNVLSIFRLLGMTDIDEIKTTISYFIKDEPMPEKDAYGRISSGGGGRLKKSMLRLNNNINKLHLFDDDVVMMTDKMDMTKASREEKEAKVNKILSTDLFPHLENIPGPDGETVEERIERIRMSKLYLLSIMVARFLEHMAGFRALDDRDSWSNKRAEGAGRQMELLFRNAWRKTLGLIQSDIDEGGIKDLTGIVEKVKASVVTSTFHDSFISSNWGVRGSTAAMKTNVAQTLSRDSVVATFAHLNLIDVGISRTDRQLKLRLVQDSQWGYICPASTPDGKNSGLLKNLAITAKVSLERSDDRIIRLLVGDEELGIEQKVFLDPELRHKYPDKIMINGKFLGWCDAELVRDFLIDLKRRAEGVPLDMAIVKEDDWLFVDTGPSRLIRPLLIVDQDQKLVIDKLGLRNADFNTLLTSGAMEYISAWEQEYIKVALTPQAIIDRLELIKTTNEQLITARAELDKIKIDVAAGRKSQESLSNATIRVNSAEEQMMKVSKILPYTHCELDELAILGVAASLIPWPNHNQAPRNTYQVSMCKQALGVYHRNYRNRFDDKAKVLPFSTRPMVETEMYHPVGLTDKGSGETVTGTFAAYPGTDEDSFVVEKEFFDNGGFRIMKYLTYTTVVRLVGDVTEELRMPDIKSGEIKNIYHAIYDGGTGDPNNGLPMIGAYLRSGDYVIGKMQYGRDENGITKRNESIKLRVGDSGIVDKVLVTTDNKSMVVTVKLRSMRRPGGGDKFSPRNAQKGTIYKLIPRRDLMWCRQTGMVPNWIMNPHCMPSRMTLAFPMEMLAGKYGLMAGTRINGGAFKPFELEKYQTTLIKYNFDPYGYHDMKSGISGKDMAIPFFMGPIFYQALKHHAVDKIQARGMGQMVPQTNQPPKGRGSKGGLRFGEMERDAGISHGASAFIRERLMKVSDYYQTAFCAKCGTFAVYDNTTKTYKKCRLCDSTSHFGRCEIPFAYKFLVQLMATMGVNLRPEFITSTEYTAKVYSKELEKAVPSGIDAIKTMLDEADQDLEEEQEEEAEDEAETTLDEIYDE